MTMEIYDTCSSCCIRAKALGTCYDEELLSTVLILLSSILKFNFFLAVLGLRCCVGFSLVVSQGYSLVVVLRLLAAVASLVAEPGQTGFSSCGTRAQ